MATMYMYRMPKTKTKWYKKLFIKLSFKKYFLCCCRRFCINQHPEKVKPQPMQNWRSRASAKCVTVRAPISRRTTETSKVREEKPCRNVLDPDNTKEYLEKQLTYLGIGGLGEQLFEILYEAFHSRCSSSLISTHVRGMLLYGPAGCGKTMLGKHFSKFLPAKEPLLIDAMVIGAKNGEIIKKARAFFEKAIADEKKYGAKSDMYVVLIDGMIDTLSRRRRMERSNDDSEEILEQLLRLMDGPDALNNIFVIATTDRINQVDEWMLRPGRFELHVKLDYPTEKQRFQILNMLLKNLRDDYLLDGDVDVQELATLTDGFASSSISQLLTQSYSHALESNQYSTSGLQLKMDDFVWATNYIKSIRDH